MMVMVNNYFFLTKKGSKKSIWKMIAMVNRATKDTFLCLKNKKKRVYGNDRNILP